MVLAHRLDVGAAVVNGVVAVARTSTVGGNDAKIDAAHEHLRIAGPTVVLGLACSGVIPRRYQSSIDDPRVASIGGGGSWQEGRQAWDEVGDDAVRL